MPGIKLNLFICTKLYYFILFYRLIRLYGICINFTWFIYNYFRTTFVRTLMF